MLHAFFQIFDVRLLIHFPLALGVIITTAGNWAFTIRNAIAARNRSRQWSPEVLRNLNQLFWAGDGDQPHHQKKGHHRSHKVGISNLPRSMCCPVAFGFASFDDNNRMRLILHASSVVVCCCGFFTARTCSSSSINDGRSLE
ncbi:Uncharacterised protein [Shigella sonnei]|nr:Uncharacterised protein [Shigella sonnei]